MFKFVQLGPHCTRTHVMTQELLLHQRLQKPGTVIHIWGWFLQFLTVQGFEYIFLPSSNNIYSKKKIINILQIICFTEQWIFVGCLLSVLSYENRYFRYIFTKHLRDFLPLTSVIKNLKRFPKSQGCCVYMVKRFFGPIIISTTMNDMISCRQKHYNKTNAVQWCYYSDSTSPPSARWLKWM